VTARTGVDTTVAAAALAALRGASPDRLHALFEHFGGAVGALDAVRAGRAAAALADHPRRNDIARRWARDVDIDGTAARLRERGTRVFSADRPDFPLDPRLDDAPAVLFAEGERAEVLDRPRVAVIGTRAATPGGLADARVIGRFLAQHGATVVSGLALGIDGAAHEGALEVGGGVIGVVATGLDVEYPPRHRPLYARVREHGLLIGEHTFGVPPSRGRFPIRNRIIAGLSDVVVVVEAKVAGGTRHTADWALRYHRDVLAMPGSRRNPSAAGCNELLRDGAEILLDPSDITALLGLNSCVSAHASGDGSGWGDVKARLSPPARKLLRAMAGDPATIDQLVVLSGATTGEVAGLVRELERAGRVKRAQGRLWPC